MQKQRAKCSKSEKEHRVSVLVRVLYSAKDNNVDYQRVGNLFQIIICFVLQKLKKIDIL